VLESRPPAPLADSASARYELAASDSGRSAAEAALADDIASAASRALAEGRRADRDRQKAATADDLEKAVRDFTEAVRIDPNYPGGYSERGQALFELGETDRAIADYSAALKHDPNYGPALRGRAMANLYRGATDRALADFSRAIQVAEIDPNRLSPLELFYARRSRATIYGNRMQLDAEIADWSAIIEAYKRDEALNVALVGI
jgi:tetratricopeptide (TPR) repeat protein